jgi:SAM-dependent methyltransferase
MAADPTTARRRAAIIVGVRAQRAPFELTTRGYVAGHLRRQGLREWLLAGPDYSRAVEYPLAARLLEARPGERLLDVGAGRRAEFSRHAAAAGLRVTALDVREDLGAEVPAGTAAIEFLNGDARALDLPDAGFERVVAISTLEHIPAGEELAVAELARVLAPGGRLVISVPFNPLRSGTVYKPGGAPGRAGGRVFFEHLYDEAALQARIVGPALGAGLRAVARIDLAEPGFKLSRWYYEPRAMPLRELRFRLPWGMLLALAAPRFLRPAGADAYDGDDWIGTPTVLAFERPAG